MAPTETLYSLRGSLRGKIEDSRNKREKKYEKVNKPVPFLGASLEPKHETKRRGAIGWDEKKLYCRQDAGPPPHAEISPSERIS